MKKTLVALAAIAATSAFAQSSVTIYGLLDAGYGNTKTTSVGGAGDIKTTGLMEGTTAGNRLGFRGVEDLGGGMKASFVLEQAVTLNQNGAGGLFGLRTGASGHQNSSTTVNGSLGTAGAGAYAGGSAATLNNARQTFVGLSGGFGEVRVGYQYTVLYTISSLSGFLGGFEGASGSDQAHVWSTGNQVTSLANSATTSGASVGGFRANAVQYISPAFSGFTAAVQYGTGGGANSETVTATESGTKRTALMLTYANGPLKAALGYTSQKNTTAGVSATAKLTQLAGSYDFGVASVNGTYNKGSSGLVAGAGVIDDTASYQLGVKMPFGAAAVFATFGKAKSENAAGTKLVDIKQQQIGATYTLSKRTSLYAVNGTTKDAVAEAQAVGTPYKGTTTRVGLVHTF